MWGVGIGGTMPLHADDTRTDDVMPGASAEATTPGDDFTNRVWAQAESGDMPGVIRVFLSDGTLISDSCWETHRLSPWKMTGDQTIAWNEDGADITANIARPSTDELTLVLHLKGGDVQQHYTAAPVPSVCPDVPNS